MAWEYVSCSKCGEDYRVQMYGPRRTREWKIENWNGVCDDCKEKERIALIEKNSSSDLPELTGSEKQIAWAFKIREEFISCKQDLMENSEIASEFTGAVSRWVNVNMDYYDAIKSAKESMHPDRFEKLVYAGFDTCMEETNAHVWIDNRHDSAKSLVGEAMSKLFIESITMDEVKEDLEAAAKAEAVVMPGHPEAHTIADISLHKDHIEISFKEKREDFRNLVKSNGYRWRSPWKKKLNFATGDPQHRLAEIGHYILAAGYPIRIMDPEAMAMAISGDFEPEHTRWISVLADSHPDSFYISWSYEDDLYGPAKRITGSRYERPGVIVPMEQLDEVLDFADIYKYRFSPAAKKLIERAQAAMAAATVANITPKEKPDLPTGNKTGTPKLAVPETVEVHDDLRD